MIDMTDQKTMKDLAKKEKNTKTKERMTMTLIKRNQTANSPPL